MLLCVFLANLSIIWMLYSQCCLMSLAMGILMNHMSQLILHQFVIVLLQLCMPVKLQHITSQLATALCKFVKMICFIRFSINLICCNFPSIKCCAIWQLAIQGCSQLALIFRPGQDNSVLSPTQIDRHYRYTYIDITMVMGVDSLQKMVLTLMT